MKNKIGIIILAGILMASCVRSASVITPENESTVTLEYIPSPTIQPTIPPSPQVTPTDTPTPETLFDEGNKALFNGDWETALNIFTELEGAVVEENLQATILFGKAKSYFLARDYLKAIEIFHSIIENYPQDAITPVAYFYLGQSYSHAEKPLEAAQAYLDYLIHRPGVIDAYILDLRADALFAGGDYPSAAKDYQAALQSPSLLDSTYIQMKLARSYALAGDYTNALNLYDTINSTTTNDYTHALIALRKGQIYTSLGQLEMAYASFLEAVQNYPTSYDSYSALVALVEAGIPVDDLQRGIVDYYAGQYGVALQAFNHYLLNNPQDPGTAHYYYGLSSRAIGSYEEAIQHWDEIIQAFPEHRFWDDAWDQKAYTQWAFIGNYDDAIETLKRFANQNPSHPRAAEFLFDVALVSERAGYLEQAADYWEQVYNLYPLSEYCPRCLFLSGIAYYRLGDYSKALATFQRYSENAQSLQEKASAFFWIGKSQHALGDTESANNTWEFTTTIDPTGYYSERANDILNNRLPFEPPPDYDLSYNSSEEKARAETWMRNTFGIAETVNLSGIGTIIEDAFFQRGTILHNLGLYNQAKAEFEQVRLASKNDPIRLYQLANFLISLGEYRTAILATRQILNLAGMDDAGTLMAPLYFNYLRFGTYYKDIVLPLSEEYNFHPLFIFSLVRQESLFDSAISSTANARGLMQIIPSTGLDISQNLGWPADYQEDDLMRPMVNLRLGVDYLDRQRKLFDGDLYAALAAYNGGPGNAIEWLKLAPEDPDLFLEIIRFEETRDYIRKVYEIFNLYRLIYQRIGP